MKKNQNSTSQAIIIILMIFYSLPVLAVHPYKPKMRDPILEPWRWQKFSEFTGKGYRCMAEGKDGTMWFGVFKGIISYNGIEWKTYTTQNGLGEGTIRSICVDRNGKLYVTNGSEIYQYSHDTWTRIFPQDNRIEWHIHNLSQSSDGSLWAGLDEGLLRIQEDSTIVYAAESLVDSLKELAPHIRIITVPKAVLTDNRFYSNEIFVSMDDELWIGSTGSNILQFKYHHPHPERSSAWRIHEGIITIYVEESQHIIEDKKGKIWVTSGDGPMIYSFDGKQWSALSFLEEFGGGDFTYTMKLAQDGSIWVGAQGSFYVNRQGTWNSYKAPTIPIPASAYTDIFITSNGTIWIAGLQNDVLRLDYFSERWKTYEDLNFHCETPDDRLWFVTKSRRVAVSNNKMTEWKSYGIEDGLIDGPVTLLCTKSGSLWASGSHGSKAAVAQFENGKWKKRIFEGFSWVRTIDHSLKRKTERYCSERATISYCPIREESIDTILLWVVLIMIRHGSI